MTPTRAPRARYYPRMPTRGEAPARYVLVEKEERQERAYRIIAGANALVLVAREERKGSASGKAACDQRCSRERDRGTWGEEEKEVDAVCVR